MPGPIRRNTSPSQPALVDPRTPATSRPPTNEVAPEGGWQPRPGAKPVKLPGNVDAPSIPKALPPGLTTGPVAKPLKIADVLMHYGWKLDSWQAQFLMS